MESLCIVLNGSLSEAILRNISRYKIIIAADAAALKLLDHSIVPSAAVGDFDSVSEKDISRIEKSVPRVVRFPKEKNYTDAELAVEEADRPGVSEVVIFGALGRRQDHALANIYLLEKLEKSGIDGKIIDERNEIFLSSTRRTIINDGKFKYVSILPLTDITVVSLSGLLYPADHLTVVRGQTIGVSNEIVGTEAVITIHAGKVLVIRSIDYA